MKMKMINKIEIVMVNKQEEKTTVFIHRNNDDNNNNNNNKKNGNFTKCSTKNSSLGHSSDKTCP